MKKLLPLLFVLLMPLAFAAETATYTIEHASTGIATANALTESYTFVAQTNSEGVNNNMTTATYDSKSTFLAVCQAFWSCTSWSACASSSQARTCTDLNNCGTTAGKPAESQSCNSGGSNPSGGSSGGGGGGGGGSGGSSGTIFKLQPADLEKGVVETVAKGDSFKINNTKTWVYLTIDNITSDKIIVSGKPILLGGSVGYDLNNDGKNDITMTLKSLSAKNASILIEEIIFGKAQNNLNSSANVSGTTNQKPAGTTNANNAKDTGLLDLANRKEVADNWSNYSTTQVILFAAVVFGVLLGVYFLKQRKKQSIPLLKNKPRREAAHK